MIKTSFQLVNLDDVSATLSITMTMKQWKELQGELTRGYRSQQLDSEILKMFGHVYKHFYTDTEIVKEKRD